MTNEDINKKVKSVVNSIEFIEDEDYEYLHKEGVEIEIKKNLEEIETLRTQLAKAKDLFAQFYQVLGAHDANENALDAALAASDGNFDFELCPYMAKVDVDDLQEQLAKANERVRELERFADAFLQLKGEEVVCSYCGQSELCKDFDIFNGGTVDGLLNKFAIEQQIKGAEEYTAYCQYLPTDSNRKLWAEQLRKEQE